MTAPARAPMIGASRFPVTVRELDGDRAWREVLAVLTLPEDDLAPRLLVYRRPGDPELETPWRRDESIVARRSVPWRIVTDDGTFVVEGERGCACGNRLKGWEPFSPMRLVIGGLR